MVFMFASSLGFLWLLGQLINALGFNGRRLRRKYDIGTLSYFSCYPNFHLSAQPIDELFSRQHEFEADACATQHTAADDLTRALVKLYE